MKYRLAFTAFDLAALLNRARFTLPPNASCVISGIRGSGTWANNLTIKRFIPGVGALNFSTARTLTAGGATPVAMASADLEGATALEIAVGTAETGWLDIIVEVESDAGPPVALEGFGVVAAL